MRTLEKIQKKPVEHIQAIFEFLVIHKHVAYFSPHFRFDIRHQIFELPPAGVIDYQHHIGLAFGIIEKYSAYESQFDIAYRPYLVQAVALGVDVGFYEQALELGQKRKFLVEGVKFDAVPFSLQDEFVLFEFIKDAPGLGAFDHIFGADVSGIELLLGIHQEKTEHPRFRLGTEQKFQYFSHNLLLISYIYPVQ